MVTTSSIHSKSIFASESPLLECVSSTEENNTQSNTHDDLNSSNHIVNVDNGSDEIVISGEENIRGCDKTSIPAFGPLNEQKEATSDLRENDASPSISTPRENKRGSNKGGKSHRDAYKETHPLFVKFLIEGRPLVEIQTLLGLKKGQMDKHSYDAFSEGVVPGKPKYRCSRWEDLGDEAKAIMTNGQKGRLVKLEGDSDSVKITFYEPQADIN